MRNRSGMTFPVDLLADVSHSELEQSAHNYMNNLLYSNPDCPEHLTLSDSTQVTINIASVGFVPLHGSSDKYKILALFSPSDPLTAVALYLLDKWWVVDDIIRTADPARDGAVEVETVGERIVLYILNRVVYRVKEMSSEELPFLCHGEKDHAKILWDNGEAVGFYSVKPSGTLCNSFSKRSYQLPVMDSIFVRKCQRGKGFGLQMLEDFVLSFKEHCLGLRYPLTKSMYRVCERYLCKYPEDTGLLWEVEGTGALSLRTNIASKIQAMNLSAVSKSLTFTEESLVITKVTEATEDILMETITTQTKDTESVECTVEIVEEVTALRATKETDLAVTARGRSNGSKRRKLAEKITEDKSEKVIRVEDIEAETPRKEQVDVPEMVQTEATVSVVPGEDYKDVTDTAPEEETAKQSDKPDTVLASQNQQETDVMITLVSEEPQVEKDAIQDLNNTSQITVENVASEIEEAEEECQKEDTAELSFSEEVSEVLREAETLNNIEEETQIDLSTNATSAGGEAGKTGRTAGKAIKTIRSEPPRLRSRKPEKEETTSQDGRSIQSTSTHKSKSTRRSQRLHKELEEESDGVQEEKDVSKTQGVEKSAITEGEEPEEISSVKEDVVALEHLRNMDESLTEESENRKKAEEGEISVIQDKQEVSGDVIDKELSASAESHIRDPEEQKEIREDEETVKEAETVAVMEADQLTQADGADTVAAASEKIMPDQILDEATLPVAGEPQTKYIGSEIPNLQEAAVILVDITSCPHLSVKEAEEAPVVGECAAPEQEQMQLTTFEEKDISSCTAEKETHEPEKLGLEKEGGGTQEDCTEKSIEAAAEPVEKEELEDPETLEEESTHVGGEKTDAEEAPLIEMKVLRSQTVKAMHQEQEEDNITIVKVTEAPSAEVDEAMSLEEEEKTFETRALRSVTKTVTAAPRYKTRRSRKKADDQEAEITEEEPAVIRRTQKRGRYSATPKGKSRRQTNQIQEEEQKKADETGEKENAAQEVYVEKADEETREKTEAEREEEIKEAGASEREDIIEPGIDVEEGEAVAEEGGDVMEEQSETISKTSVERDVEVSGEECDEREPVMEVENGQLPEASVEKCPDEHEVLTKPRILRRGRKPAFRKHKQLHKEEEGEEAEVEVDELPTIRDVEKAPEMGTIEVEMDKRVAVVVEVEKGMSEAEEKQNTAGVTAVADDLEQEAKTDATSAEPATSSATLTPGQVEETAPAKGQLSEEMVPQLSDLQRVTVVLVDLKNTHHEIEVERTTTEVEEEHREDARHKTEDGPIPQEHVPGSPVGKETDRGLLEEEGVEYENAVTVEDTEEVRDENTASEDEARSEEEPAVTETRTQRTQKAAQTKSTRKSRRQNKGGEPKGETSEAEPEVQVRVLRRGRKSIPVLQRSTKKRRVNQLLDEEEEEQEGEEESTVEKREVEEQVEEHHMSDQEMGTMLDPKDAFQHVEDIEAQMGSEEADTLTAESAIQQDALEEGQTNSTDSTVVNEHPKARDEKGTDEGKTLADDPKATDTAQDSVTEKVSISTLEVLETAAGESSQDTPMTVKDDQTKDISAEEEARVKRSSAASRRRKSKRARSQGQAKEEGEDETSPAEEIQVEETKAVEEANTEENKDENLEENNQEAGAQKDKNEELEAELEKIEALAEDALTEPEAGATILAEEIQVEENKAEEKEDQKSEKIDKINEEKGAAQEAENAEPQVETEKVEAMEEEFLAEDEAVEEQPAVSETCTDGQGVASVGETQETPTTDEGQVPDEEEVATVETRALRSGGKAVRATPKSKTTKRQHEQEEEAAGDASTEDDDVAVETRVLRKGRRTVVATTRRKSKRARTQVETEEEGKDAATLSEDMQAEVTKTVSEEAKGEEKQNKEKTKNIEEKNEEETAAQKDKNAEPEVEMEKVESVTEDSPPEEEAVEEEQPAVSETCADGHDGHMVTPAVSVGGEEESGQELTVEKEEMAGGKSKSMKAGAEKGVETEKAESEGGGESTGGDTERMKGAPTEEAAVPEKEDIDTAAVDEAATDITKADETNSAEEETTVTEESTAAESLVIDESVDEEEALTSTRTLRSKTKTLRATPSQRSRRQKGTEDSSPTGQEAEDHAEERAGLKDKLVEPKDSEIQEIESPEGKNVDSPIEARRLRGRIAEEKAEEIQLSKRRSKRRRPQVDYKENDEEDSGSLSEEASEGDKDDIDTSDINEDNKDAECLADEPKHGETSRKEININAAEATTEKENVLHLVLDTDEEGDTAAQEHEDDEQNMSDEEVEPVVISKKVLRGKSVPSVIITPQPKSRRHSAKVKQSDEYLSDEEESPRSAQRRSLRKRKSTAVTPTRRSKRHSRV